MITVAHPGTFDPITFGHESIIRRSAEIFDRVVVAVATSAHKQPMFTLEDRLEMAREVLKEHGSKVEVMPVRGLLAQFLAEHGIKLIVRGMRTVADYEFEIQLADVNRRQGDGVETLFMAPSADYVHVFSSVVREIAMLGGDISDYVSKPVERRFIDKFGSTASGGD